MVDRTRERADIARMLRDANVRMLTLTGPGGVGKTRLAVAAAADVASTFADGVVFVGLASVNHVDLVIPTIAWNLGLRDMGGDPLMDRLLHTLATRHLLLVLDNFEHVVGAGPQIHEILAECARVTLLVTSRVRLRLSGEREILIAPLSPPPRSASLSKETLEENAAIQLFVERARAVSPGFALTSESLSSVSGIVHRLDGLPLAIELAAARVKTFPPATLLGRLSQQLPLLSDGARDLPVRQQTMRDTIAWSHNLLAPAEQALFRRLAIFACGFTLEAAEAVGASLQGADGPTPGADVVVGVASLVEQSLLVQYAAQTEEPRFRMLDTVREYGLDRLRAAGAEEERAAWSAHAGHFLHVAETTRRELYAIDHEQALARLDTELDNVRAALSWSTTAHESDIMLRLATAMGSYWITRGHFHEGERWLKQALDSSAPRPSALRADALMSCGVLATSAGNIAAAEPLLIEGLEMARACASPQVEALALTGLGMVYLQRDEPDRAAEWTDLALARFADIENLIVESDFFMSVTYTTRGMIAHLQGDALAAARFLEEAERRQREGHFWGGLCDTLCTLGSMMLAQDDIARSMTYFQESLELARDHDQHRRLARSLFGLAQLAIVQGDPERATRFFSAAEALRERIGASLAAWNRPAILEGIQAARAALSPEAHAAEEIAGRTLPLDTIIAEALATPVPPSGSLPVDPAIAAGLTPREREVLPLLAEGLSDREIAGVLSISDRTAGNHVMHILQKLNVDSRTAAAVYAVRHKLA
ncbi:MAG: LuxR C-terminal-related transcriptional regulator [Thermomicrobiales bacterium]